MATNVQVLVTAALVACVAAFVSHGVAFATQKWMVSNQNSPFKSVGYFLVCFNKCMVPFCPVADEQVLNGCYAMWPQFQDDYYVDQLWHWLTPDWFQTCRNLCIFIIPLIFVAIIIISSATLIIWKKEDISPKKHRKSYFIFMAMLYIGAILLALAVALVVVVLSTFYVGAFRVDYMPYYYKNHLGYSYWIEVAAVVFLVASCILTFVAIIVKTVGLDSQEMYSDEQEVSERMMMPMSVIS